MKLLKFILIILLIYPSIASAETITTGNAYVNTSVSTNANDGNTQTHVETNVQSSGESSVSVSNHVETNSSSETTSTSNTYKKIEMNINGEKKVVESSEPGEIRIDVGAQSPTPRPSVANTFTASPTPMQIKDSKNLEKNITTWVKDFISDVFSKIF